MRAKFVSFFLFCLFFFLLAGCEASGSTGGNIHVQLNNFTNKKVNFWTNLKTKRDLVPENSQDYRQEAIVQVDLEVGLLLTVYVQVENSQNAIDGQASYTVRLKHDATTEAQDVEVFCTWNGSSLSCRE